jgi:hypothetical protein
LVGFGIVSLGAVGLSAEQTIKEVQDAVNCGRPEALQNELG